MLRQMQHKGLDVALVMLTQTSSVGMFSWLGLTCINKGILPILHIEVCSQTSVALSSSLLKAILVATRTTHPNLSRS